MRLRGGERPHHASFLKFRSQIADLVAAGIP
jgi:hypothetical protein